MRYVHIFITLMHFQVQNLETAANDIGKDILPQHLILVADCLSATGEFVGLNAKGIAQQKGHTSVSSPFVQACFSVSTMLIFIHLCNFLFCLNKATFSHIIHGIILEFCVESWCLLYKSCQGWSCG